MTVQEQTIDYWLQELSLVDTSTENFLGIIDFLWISKIFLIECLIAFNFWFSDLWKTSY